MNLKFDQLSKDLQIVIENEIASYHMRSKLGHAEHIKFMKKVKEVRLIEVMTMINSYELNKIINGLCN